MHPKDLSILDFSYELPEEKIAVYPLAKRDESKLLVYKGRSVEDSQYKHLANYLPEKTLLVFNNTKVVEARLHFSKPTGGLIELFCLEPAEQYADITTAMLQTQKVQWKCLVGGAKKWKEGPIVKNLDYKHTSICVEALVVEKRNDYFLIEFSWNSSTLSFAELLHAAGSIPLPPYLNRATEEADKSSYQTIYAKHDGSVAAPTAGLHFTEDLFDQLSKKQIDKAYVTLHVGAGTFKPVKAAVMAEHEMHAEFIDVDVFTIQQLLTNLNQGIVAVGTTSLRTIESLYWMGVKAMDTNLSLEEISIQQWDAYELVQTIGAKKALQSLLHWMAVHHTDRIVTKTQIIIAPPYRLKIAKGIITNFHQPQSTLLLLVAAVVGSHWKSIYQHALANQYRFLSYGDGCLLWKH